MEARRRIGRKADRRFMTQFEMRQDARLLDHLVKGQHEIAGNPEDFARTMRLERRQESGCERGHVRVSHERAIATIAGVSFRSQPGT